MKVCLNYKMVLTQVFKAFSVFLERESLKKLLSHDDYYDRMLNRMGYWKVIGH